jgi:thiol:disulfide interchange protein DsbC
MTFPTRRTPLRLAAACTLAACALLLATAASAQTPTNPLTPEAAAIKKLLEQKLPGATVKGVTKTPYFGLYEVQLEEQLIYTDAKANYLLIGSVYDTNTKKNLTELRQRELNRVAWDSLPFDLAFKRVKGNGERKLVIFSDADCPFCARLEQELKSVDNVTIYTFLYPIDSLHPDAARKSRMIWCSADRVKAWNEFFATGALPDNNGDCDNPVVATSALGQKLKVAATPTLVFADGSVVPGALPAQQIESEFAQAATVLAKASAAKK